MKYTVSLMKSLSQKRTFVNISKADWSGFTELTKSVFAKTCDITNVCTAEKFCRKRVNEAAKNCIP